MKEGYLQITLTVPLTKTKNKYRTNKYLMVICFSDYFDEGYDEGYLSKPTNYPTNQSNSHDKFTKLDNRPGFLNNRHSS